MNKKILAVAILASTFTAMLAKQNDPVVMNVAGQDVRLSEFEYLFNKNNSQQSQPVSFDEYVDMFIDYKLKVADAHACGIDTTKKFLNEFNRFASDLSEPYLEDVPTREKLIQEAYDRKGREVKVRHIMFPRNNAPGDDNASKLDSLRQRILNGEITFEEAAAQYSIDKGTAQRGGLMGWLTSGGRVPPAFEIASYNTPIGEVSEVVNSGMGFHLVKVDATRPARGEVNASHILLLTRDMDPEAKAAVKQRIDSIRAIATPENFAELAEKYSQDPGSARRGGDLGWFGSGRMVAEFDSTAFALRDGEISDPVATQFGWHIVYKTGHRGDVLPPIDSLRQEIIKSFENDPRRLRPVEVTLENLAIETKSAMNPNLKADIAAWLEARNLTVCDSVMNEALKQCDVTAYKIKGKAFPVSSLMKRAINDGMELRVVPMELENRASGAYRNAMVEIARQRLYDTNPEYRNLYNEYRDGIMLFEISNQKVWDRATKDKEGLEAYFQAHRADYTWPSPKYKAFVIFANSDSTLAAAKAYTDGIDPATVDPDAFTADLKEKFGKNVKVERVIAAKGDNAITDYLGFGEERPADNANNRWKIYYAFGGKVINAPEEASDVRGQAISDYQAYLEQEWVKGLREQYPVKVNKKALAKAQKDRK